MNAAACVAVLVLALVCIRHRDVRVGLLVRLWPWVVLGALLGAHLYYLVGASDVPLSRRSLADVVNVFEGSAVQGGILGGSLAAVVFLRLAGAPVLAVIDALTPAGAAAQALTRVGCFLAGCCYGRPAPAALGVVFTDPASLAPLHAPLYPAQLIEAALMLVLAVALYRRLVRRDTPDGRLLWLYLAGYGLIRFTVQFFRGDDADRLVWGLAHSQYAALAMMLFAAAMLARRPARS
jgi:phosphatidylglycerol:prolipoprotein diacylglycerol transferase